MIIVVRSITHDVGNDNAEAKFTDPMDTCLKALVTSDPVLRGRGHVQSHFSANPKIDNWIDFVQMWSINL